MKPPSKDAITKALNILLESIQEENKLSFASSCSHPLDVIPFEQLTTNVEALGLAKAHLYKEAEDLISRIQHHRNLAAPIHRLPQEIFAMILEYFAAGQQIDDKYGLLQLLWVGRLWNHTIVNTPRLWTRLDSVLSPKIGRLIIERSKHLPLSFNWDGVDIMDEYQEEHGEILEMAVQNSARFNSMNLQVSSHDPFEILPLLERPTTALEDLKVEANKDADVGVDGLGEFILSEGAPLKSLVLHDISLNFDSPRLAGLVTLSLYRAAVPNSLNILLQVLSAAQRLEQLTVCDNGWHGIEPIAPGPQVTLGHLKDLEIQGITDKYCAALLSSIYTPVCSRVCIRDVGESEDSDALDLLIWQPGTTQMAALLGFNQQLDTSTPKISIAADHDEVHIHDREQQGGGARSFSFMRPQPLQTVKLLGQFFTDVPFCPPIHLTIEGTVFEDGPVDLTPWSTCLESLDLLHPIYSLRAMEQLAEHTVTTNANETGASAARAEDWMCPNLRYITLRVPAADSQPDSYGAALLSLVRTRWLRMDGGPTPAIQPDKFVIMVTRPSSKTQLDVETEVKKLVPSAVFHWGR